MSDSESGEVLQISIKSSGDKKYEVSVSADATVGALKTQLEEVASVPAGQQRLIYSGRVLKDNGTLASYNVKTGHTVHLVKGAARSAGGAPPAAAAPTRSDASSSAQAVPSNLATGQVAGDPLSDLTGARYAGLTGLPSASLFGPDGGMGPMPDMDQLLSMMETPEFSETMQRILSDPSMLQSNPMLRDISPERAQQMQELMNGPEFRNLVANPQAMRQFLQVSQQMESLHNLLGGGVGSVPAAGTPQNTPGEASSGDAAGRAAGGANPAVQNPFSALLGGLPGSLSGGLPGSTPFNMFGAPPQQETDTRPPEERYESQLRQLNELGFYDFERNVTALRRSGGNVQGAVEALLDGQV